MLDCTRYQLDELQDNDFSDVVEVSYVKSITRAFMGRWASHVLPVARASATPSSGNARRDSRQPGLFDQSKDRLPTGRVSDNFRGGFDGGIELGWYGDFVPSVFDKLCKRLDLAKERSDLGDTLNSFVRVGRYTVKVAPMGILQGRIKYKYVIEYHGVKIYIHGNPEGNIQPVRCRIGALALLRKNPIVVYKTIINILHDIGFLPVRELVSRADLQIMLSGVRVSDVAAAMSDGRTVTLARGKCMYVGNLATSDLESITVRSSTAELCIYDKIAEVLHNKQPGYLQSFVARYYPDGLPETLTRFEYRITGESLRSFGICSFCDLVQHSRGLVKYYSETWFRLTERRKVRGMGTRQQVGALWQTVQRAFGLIFMQIGFLSVAKVKSAATVPDVARLVRVGVGCLARAVALVADTVDAAFDDTLNIFNRLVDGQRDYLQEKVCDFAISLDIKDGYYA